MSYNATVLKVMIASPGDVAQERRLVREAIHEWNAIHADDRQLVLMPIGWETHSSPDTGDRAQAIIDGQLLKDADLLIAVFWTRLGSPTGTTESGTVEEINEHVAAGKPAMIYFSSAPVRPDSVDPVQYTALQAFKGTCKAQGLIVEYENLSQFRELVFRHLAQTVIRRFLKTPTNLSVHAADSLDRTNSADMAVGGPALTLDARELLVEASQDSQGVILAITTMDGLSVQTHGRQFVERGSPRSAARWKEAVEELWLEGFIQDRAGAREVYFLTDEGYRVGDQLRIAAG